MPETSSAHPILNVNILLISVIPVEWGNALEQSETEFEPDDRLLNIAGVREIVPLSRTSIWRAQKKISFPKPRPLMGTKVWSHNEVQKWLRDFKAGKFKDAP